MESKVIPIKHGTEDNYKEAYANLDTETIEDVPWDEGPSNAFYGSEGAKPRSCGIGNPAYEENYAKIDWGRKEEEDAEEN